MTGYQNRCVRMEDECFSLKQLAFILVFGNLNFSIIKLIKEMINFIGLPDPDDEIIFFKVFQSNANALLNVSL